MTEESRGKRRKQANPRRNRGKRREDENFLKKLVMMLACCCSGALTENCARFLCDFQMKTTLSFSPRLVLFCIL